MPLLKKPLRKGKEDVTPVETDQYIDLGSMFFAEESAMGGSMVKVCEIYRYEDVNNLTQPVYDGNVLLIDYSNMANDTAELKRVTNELKNVARDTNGDVAAIGNNLIVVTPNGMRIDRHKIKGGFQ
ncbi:MAG: hypothetical protein A4E32_01230 [Methanomassiliicoccales archaeon PtaU1.Bin124]|nr:MAG: hypothetical protein A4E32_01230 [Methanomassiliicoccales archaeon PtaU1.Bin124]